MKTDSQDGHRAADGASSLREQYDIVVVGSGIGGTPLAMALSRVGLSVLVVERGAHPRFAIGESTVPETTLGFDYLARTYGIPELRTISHYLGLKTIDCVGYPKLHFWFGHHREDEPLDPAHELMIETFPMPIGPDVHLMRADVDAFLVSRLGKYGVDYRDRTEVTEFETKPDAVELVLRSGDEENRVRGRLVVDASGHGSFFGHKLGLRRRTTALQTQTRSIFGHFEGVELLDAQLGGRNPAFRNLRQGGTQHHCFEGGWIWVIPFDNNVCSVGAMLDPRHFPLQTDLSPEEELQALIRKFPSIQRHLGGMRAIRPVIRTPGRVQFDSESILADRVVLTPHAAGFIDALFSTGIPFSNGFIARFVPLAKKALEADVFDMEIFRPLERTFFAELTHADNLVDAVTRSFRDFDVFKQAWRCWTHSIMLRVTMGVGGDMSRSDGCKTMTLGAADVGWTQTVARVRQMIVDGEQTPAKRLAEQLRAVLDEVSHPFDLSKYAVGAETASCLGFWDISFTWAISYLRAHPEMDKDYSPVRMAGFMGRTAWRMAEQRFRYVVSAIRGDAYHRQVDWLRMFRNTDAPVQELPELRSFA